MDGGTRRGQDCGGGSRVVRDRCLNFLHAQNERDLDGAAPHFERAFTIYQKLVADYPDSPRYLDSLNAARTNLATLHMQSPTTREAGVQLLRDAVASQQQLVARVPKSTEYRTQLAMMVGNLGTYEHDSGDFERGCALLGEALDRHAELLAEQPGNPVLQMRSLVFGLKLVHVRTQDGDARAAWATLQKLEPLVASDWLTLRRLAGPTLAACAVAQGDAALTPAEREATAQALLDHGAALMTRAIDGGYKDNADLENAPVFAPLRASTHYPALRAKLAAAAK